MGLLLAACSPAIPYYRYRYDAEAASRNTIHRVVLRSVTAPEELLENKSRIDEALAACLQSANLVVVPFESTRAQWQAAFANADDAYNPATGEADPEKLKAIYQDYLARVARADIADAVIEPAVVRRHAKLSSKVALWDGVRRRIPMTNDYNWEWSGEGDVLSLRVAVFAVDGPRILVNYGGLEYPYEYAWKGRKMISRLRDDLFTDPAVVRESVRIALHPFVPNQDIPAHPRFYEDHVD